MNEIIISGLGGQGVLLTGLILANIAMNNEKNVTWIPSYGSEKRGGSANCALKISSDEIASPYCKKIDILIAMSKSALEKFQDDIKEKGTLIVNSSMVKDMDYRSDIKVVETPMNEIATSMDNPRGANIAALGAIASATEMFNKEAFIAEIENYLKKKNIDPINNIKVFEAGFKYVEEGR